MRVERHKSGVWVREDGCIYLPQSGKHPAHWTFGNGRGNGYLAVRVAGKSYYVHRLVVETYFGEIPPDCEVDHINRNRSDNHVANLRIVTRCENHRNTSKNDSVDARGGTHWYTDPSSYYRERSVRYRERNPEKCREYASRCYKNKWKTHRVIQFANGSKHWVPNEDALLLLAIPLSHRIYKG